MTDGEKRRFDALETLRKSAWDSFDKRRTFEWKICISLWTAFAAYIGAVLTGRLTDRIGLSTIIAVLSASILIVGLHTSWIRGLGRANRLDRKIAFYFCDLMIQELSVRFPEEIVAEINYLAKRMGLATNWSHFFQIGVTMSLAAGAVSVTALAF